MEHYLSELNEQQRQAVEYCSGPQLVIAGAGSGKTRVLTYKIVHLLKLGYRPSGILALTFTNKAAREMRERIESLTGPEVASRLWMGTFHSIFGRILRMNAERIGYTSNYTIYDSADSRSLLKMIIRDMNLDDKVYAVNKVHNAISWAKNALISPEEYALDRELTMADKNARRPEIYRIYEAYMQRCRAAQSMDFDDLLYYTYRLFDENPDVLRRYRDFFSYVLVDEYQDTNSAQFRIINQLCQGKGNLMVVGDDAQSIYSFRGANIANILNLGSSYPDLKQFKLEQNYRSTRNIINAAGSLIEKNQDRIPKTVFSVNSDGDRVKVVEAYTDMEEARLVASAISSLKMRTRDSYDEFAILYRTNAQSRVLEEALRTRNIPYRIYGGLSFYQRKEVKDAVAYLRLIVNPDDEEALRRVINFPARGIGDTTLGKLSHCAIESGVSIWTVITNPDEYDAGLNRGTKAKIAGFVSLIEAMRRKNSDPATDAYEMTRYMVQSSGMMNEFMSSSTPENVSRRENIEELVSAAKSFVESRVEQGLENTRLVDMLAEVSLATDQDSDDDAADGIMERVTLMTVHAAKGLEFNNVFIVGVEEDLFPSVLSQDTAAQVEEERRLLYVAITRARSHCSMSYAKSRFRNGMTAPTRPSRFFADIDPIYLSAPGSTLGRAVSSTRATFSPQHRNLTPSNANPVNLQSLRQPQPLRQQTAPPVSAPGSDGFVKHTAEELKVGMTIRHATFGEGVIRDIDTSSTDARVEVRFDGEKEVRKLMLKYAKFIILSE